MRGEFGGGHGMHLVAMVPKWAQGRPPEFYKLRKKAKNHPELWTLAKEILDREHLASLGQDPKTSEVRHALRAKVAENAVSYMGLDEDKPL